MFLAPDAKPSDWLNFVADKAPAVGSLIFILKIVPFLYLISALPALTLVGWKKY
jgi:hypothetical protein